MQHENFTLHQNCCDMLNEDSEYSNQFTCFNRQYSISQEQFIVNRTDCDVDSLQEDSTFKWQNCKRKIPFYSVESQIKEVSSQSEQKKVSSIIPQFNPQKSHNQYRLSQDEQEKQKKSKPDYRKNICGYVTKKIVKEALDQQFSQQINSLCRIHNIKVSQFQEAYKNMLNKITGPTHLYMLTSINKELLCQLSQQKILKEIKLKSIFRKFFIWFLRNRYLRYIISQGKMREKQIYIKYKNLQLLTMIRQQQLENQANINQILSNEKQIEQKISLKQKQCEKFLENRLYYRFHQVNKSRLKNSLKEKRKKCFKQKKQIEQNVNSEISSYMD